MDAMTVKLHATRCHSKHQKASAWHVIFLLAVAYWRAMAHSVTVLLMTSPNSAALGTQVRERRLRLGMTQQKAATACGISLRTFARIETGRQVVLRDITLASIDRGLAWEPGSAHRVLHEGGEPEALPRVQAMPGDDPLEWVMRQDWSNEKKLRVLEAIRDIDDDGEGEQRAHKAR
jgi:DNA-binding XRE family transcriptional regulator